MSRETDKAIQKVIDNNFDDTTSPPKRMRITLEAEKVVYYEYTLHVDVPAHVTSEDIENINQEIESCVDNFEYDEDYPGDLERTGIRVRDRSRKVRRYPGKKVQTKSSVKVTDESRINGGA